MKENKPGFTHKLLGLEVGEREELEIELIRVSHNQMRHARPCTLNINDGTLNGQQGIRHVNDLNYPGVPALRASQLTQSNPSQVGCADRLPMNRNRERTLIVFAKAFAIYTS